MSPGDPVYIKDRATHIWSANPSEEETQVLFTIFGRPGDPIVTYREEGFKRLSFEEAMEIANKSQ